MPHSQSHPTMPFDLVVYQPVGWLGPNSVQLGLDPVRVEKDWAAANHTIMHSHLAVPEHYRSSQSRSHSIPHTRAHTHTHGNGMAIQHTMTSRI